MKITLISQKALTSPFTCFLKTSCSNFATMFSVLLFLVFFLPTQVKATTIPITATGTYGRSDGISLNVTAYSGSQIDLYDGSGGAAGSLMTSDITSSPSTLAQRWGMVWRINAAGGGSNSVTITFDISNYTLSGNAGTNTNYRLLSRATGTSGTWTDVSSASTSTDQISFSIAIPGGSNLDYTVATTNISQSPLPVKLLTFTGVSQGTVNVITWKTATEINNDKFVIEKSMDGENFIEAGTVQGSGNSNEIKLYQFIDNDPYIGLTFYKLTQKDFNGVSETFQPIKVKSDAGPAKVLVYPNPSTGIVKVRNDEVFQENSLRITNSVGVVVVSRSSSNVDIDMSQFASGIYTVYSGYNEPIKLSILK